MTRLVLTQQLARLTTVPELDVHVPELRAALEEAFAANPRLRAYILDDQGHLRENVAIFIDGLRLHDRIALDQPLEGVQAIHVMQALSGG